MVHYIYITRTDYCSVVVRVSTTMTGVPIMLRLLCLLVWLASWTANAIDIQRLLLQQQKQLDELEDKLEDALETFERQDNVPDFTNLLVSTLSATLGEQYGKPKYSPDCDIEHF